MANLSERYEKQVQRDFVTALKRSNIPMFAELAKDPAILTNYFKQRRSFYYLVLGKTNVAVLDYLLTNAITEGIANSIIDKLNGTHVAYPGSWGPVTVGRLVSRIVNITQPSDNLDGDYYLTWRTRDFGITEEELKNDADSIPFSEYHCDRLYRLCTRVKATVMDTIMESIKREYPTAGMHTSDETIIERYAREVALLSADKYKSFLAYREQNPVATYDELVKAYSGLSNTNIIGYVSGLTALSGLSESACKLIEKSQANVVATPAERCDGNIMSNQCVCSYYIMSTPDVFVPEEGGAPINIKLMEIRPIDIHLLVTKTGTMSQQNRAIQRVGKAIEDGMYAMIRYITTLALATPELLIEAPSAMTAVDNAPTIVKDEEEKEPEAASTES